MGLVAAGAAESEPTPRMQTSEERCSRSKPAGPRFGLLWGPVRHASPPSLRLLSVGVTGTSALSKGLGRGRLGGHQHALEVGLGLDPLAQALEDACSDRGRQREHTALAQRHSCHEQLQKEVLLLLQYLLSLRVKNNFNAQ